MNSSDNSGLTLQFWCLCLGRVQTVPCLIITVQTGLCFRDGRYLLSWVFSVVQPFLIYLICKACADPHPVYFFLSPFAPEREELYWVSSAERACVQQACQLQELLAESQLSVGPESVRVPRFARWDRHISIHKLAYWRIQSSHAHEKEGQVFNMLQWRKWQLKINVVFFFICCCNVAFIKFYQWDQE